jgi:hypothetical protein
MAFFWAPKSSSWFPCVLGAEVDDAQDGSERYCFMTLFCLATKLALMGVDVDRLTCPYTILQPTVVRRGDRPLTWRCPIPSLQWGGGAFLVAVKPLGLDIWWSIDHVDDSIAESYME